MTFDPNCSKLDSFFCCCLRFSFHFILKRHRKKREGRKAEGRGRENEQGKIERERDQLSFKYRQIWRPLLFIFILWIFHKCIQWPYVFWSYWSCISSSSYSWISPAMAPSNHFSSFCYNTISAKNVACVHMGVGLSTEAWETYEESQC